MTVLALTLQKGGVGKTSTTLTLGVELAKLGAKVLLVDLDPQSNLTQAMGYDPVKITSSVYEVMLTPEHGIDHARITTRHGVDLIPATLTLAGAEVVFSGRIGRELLLRTALAERRQDYDYVLIDTPPSLGVFTVNALAAADEVLGPLQAHVLALKAMPQLEETMRLVRQLNPPLRLGGVVLTMVSPRTMLTQAIEDEARQQYGDLVFKSTIPLTIKMAEAPASGEPIGAYAPDSSAARAYRALAREVTARYDK